MKRKLTVAALKDVLNRAGDKSGYAFDKNGPYFVNSGRLAAMKAKFQQYLEIDECRDEAVKHIAPRTIVSINNWFAFLADRYGV